MKQIEIKQVKEQLTLYGVPQATLHYVNDGMNEPIKNSQEVTDMLRNNWEPGTLEAHESFYLILLNRANRVKGIVLHSKGGLSGTVIDTRTLLAAALLAFSCNIIVAHNHPSGNIQPSDADIKITEKINKAAELCEIKLLDHIIITRENYFSFADEGLIQH